MSNAEALKKCLSDVIKRDPKTPKACADDSDNLSDCVMDYVVSKYNDTELAGIVKKCQNGENPGDDIALYMTCNCMGQFCDLPAGVGEGCKNLPVPKPVPRPAKKGFFSTTAGKVTIGIGVSILVALIVWFTLFKSRR